ncbi:hypothetical protein QR680_016238 [Steinernema hermaphroditum]|uniref:DNA topoisomerase 2 n=1 Tax=Steinernema hermaphroditum TaxID=289476 RepID=A0AA39LM83_9BILA|nr:hypothetical protein QR680_016238 [Steinernema hermaphroditum]
MATIEQIYQKKSQLEHILLRPDTYIGSVEYTDKAPMWVYDVEKDAIVQREISYVPGLYKIFDEVLVNAADNKQRDSKMNLIKITIDKAKNEISVYNNGKGIPVVMHKEEQVYVPEMIFGTLLTSSNYNDDEKKVTGGRNGYGAKLCNIFSTSFTLETSTKEFKKKFKQTWINNMTKDEECVVEKADSDDYTKVTFTPDLKKFKMKELDDDIIALMSRRAFDVAGSTKGVTVFLNGKKIPVQGFEKYIKFYTKNFEDEEKENSAKVVFESAGSRWEVGLTTSDRGFQQVSFVNSIATTKGGRHVDHVVDLIVAKLIETINKKLGKKSSGVKPFQVKNHLWVFVNALIENPTFDSQTKETMTLQAKNFGSKCVLSEKFYGAALKCGIVDNVMSWVRFKEQEKADKKSGKKTTKIKGVPKLEDANDAGTKNAHLCTLILTEGDSAKSLAVSGLGVVGRDRFGVFPLRGKMLNVREGSQKQINENAEINSMLKIVGLQYRKKYDSDEDMKSLRYGKIMIMADQDQDGSHIKGLVINFIHHNWPALIRRNFVEEFITPIVKATKGRQEFSFYSIPEYTEWRQNTDNWQSFRIKYYKGLGTSTSKEAKEYFSDMVRHRIKFNYGGRDDDDAVDLAFSKKKIEERKLWLTRWMQVRKERREQGQIEDYLYDKDTRAVTFSDFINKELVLFSNTDNERSIPSLVDGLKPGQRKVMFTCFKRADKKEVKVAQLAGAVGEMSAYHHGEQSLMMTIVNLAQDYVGSNNINLLLPIGQFGTRLQGGKDSASPRYIFTQLNPVTRALFPSADDNVLRFLYEENQRIEPEWYCPIIPTVLVNGAEGIGTGWSTKVPNFNPREIVDNIRRLIRGESLKKMVPCGECAVVNDETIEITELPIKIWTQNYKESVIEAYTEGKEKMPEIITDYKEYHTDQTVKFVVKMAPEKLRQAESEGLHKVFKLQNVINTTSMVLFDAAGCLRKFDTPEEICQEFFETRKNKYIERKAYLEGMLRAQSRRLTNQARFIVAKIKGEIVMENKRKAAIVEQLVRQKYDPDPVKKWKEEQKKKELEMNGEIGADSDAENDQAEEQSDEQKRLDTKLSDYDYLVGMALIKLSEEEKDKLLKESDDKMKELRDLEAKTWADLWTFDLDNFLVELDKQETKERNDMNAAIKTAVKKFEKDAPKGRGRKGPAIDGLMEVRPNPNAVRVEPSIAALKEKYEPKVKRERKPKEEGAETKKRVKKPKDDDETKQKAPKKSKKKKDESDEESDDDLILLSDDDSSRAASRASSRKGDEKAKKAEKRASAVKKSKTAESDEDDDCIIEDSDEDVKPKKAKKAPAAPKAKQVPAPKKSRKIESEDEDDDSDEDVKPKKAKKAPAAAKEKKGPASKKSKKIESEDEEDFIADDSDEDVKPKKGTKRKLDNASGDDEPGPSSRRAGRAAAQKKTFNSDMFASDSDDEDFVIERKKGKVVESESDYEMSD